MVIGLYRSCRLIDNWSHVTFHLHAFMLVCLLWHYEYSNLYDENGIRYNSYSSFHRIVSDLGLILFVVSAYCIVQLCIILTPYASAICVKEYPSGIIRRRRPYIAPNSTLYVLLNGRFRTRIFLIIRSRQCCRRAALIMNT